jgi:hypothetical protein
VTDPQQTYDPPQDTGAPDAAETDPAALNPAEQLDLTGAATAPQPPEENDPDQGSWQGDLL